jgi:hypothetical protein
MTYPMPLYSKNKQEIQLNYNIQTLNTRLCDKLPTLVKNIVSVDIHGRILLRYTEWSKKLIRNYNIHSMVALLKFL